MASNYKIGQQPQAQPMEQYPPFYDPQKQKEKQDLENAPMQLMNMFANAKGFEGASWQADEYTRLNQELGNKMKHILFSDYSPAAKQYAAAALLIDNLTGDMYNKRMSLNEYKVQEDEYDKQLAGYVAQKQIDTETAEMMRKINNGKNKKIYKKAIESGSGIPHPEQYFVPIINNSDNFYNPKFYQLKKEGSVNVSSGSAGDIRADLAGSSTSKNAGRGNISFEYYNEERYENDAATIFMQDLESPYGYLTKAKVYEDYISIISEELGSGSGEFEKERKKAEAILFSNAPKIYTDPEKTKLVTDLDIISDIYMGLKLDDVKAGERTIKKGEGEGVTYYFNFKEFADDNKELVLNKEEIELIENSSRTYNSATRTYEYKKRSALTLSLSFGNKVQYYTNQAITAQSNEDMAEFTTKGNALFNLRKGDLELIDSIMALNTDNTNSILANDFLNGIQQNKTLLQIANDKKMSIESTEILLPSAEELKKYIEKNNNKSYNDVLSWYYSQSILNVSVKTRRNTLNSGNNTNPLLLNTQNDDKIAMSFYLPLDLNIKADQQRTTIQFSSEIQKIFNALKEKEK